MRPLTAQLCPQAQRAHGLAMADLERAQRWPRVAADLLAWIDAECRRAGGCVPVFIGHNVEK